LFVFKTQETAIHYCASSGNIYVFCEVTKRYKLDKLQALINRQSKNGSSPLLVAAEKGNIKIIKLLLQFNARSDIFDEVKTCLADLLKLLMLFFNN
jgi:ankyrin repeat protein